MKILVYKRTHVGDPGPDGCFGVHDCMGAVRDREYDAVIGVGGIGSEPKFHGIAGTVNWIGVGPHKTYNGKRGPEVTFDHFVYYGCDGADFVGCAPVLAKHMYDQNVRSILHGLTEVEYAEARVIVAWADGAPPSPLLKGDTGDERAFSACKRTAKTRCS